MRTQISRKAVCRFLDFKETQPVNGGGNSMPSNPFVQHYIKVWFESIEKPLVFPVTKESSDRFCRNYEDEREGFFICDTSDGRCIAINLVYVQIAQLLWETPLLDKPPRQVSSWVQLSFYNRQSDSFAVEEPDELADLLLSLETEANSGMLSFTDSDGELVMFYGDNLVLLEACARFVEEGWLELRG